MSHRKSQGICVIIRRFINQIPFINPIHISTLCYQRLNLRYTFNTCGSTHAIQAGLAHIFRYQVSVCILQVLLTAQLDKQMVLSLSERSCISLRIDIRSATHYPYHMLHGLVIRVMIYERRGRKFKSERGQEDIWVFCNRN